MNYCKDCDYAKQSTFDGPPGPNGRPTMGRGLGCTHPELGHPVNGMVLPCDAVRMDDNFCGIKGKYFEIRAETANVPDDKPRIQVAS